MDEHRFLLLTFVIPIDLVQVIAEFDLKLPLLLEVLPHSFQWVSEDLHAKLIMEKQYLSSKSCKSYSGRTCDSMGHLEEHQAPFTAVDSAKNYTEISLPSCCEMRNTVQHLK